jgi:hypothetical protein
LSRPRIGAWVGIGGLAAVSALAAFLAIRYFSITSFVDPRLRASIEVKNPAAKARGADLAITFLDPGNSGFSAKSSWSEAARARSLLTPDRVLRFAVAVAAGATLPGATVLFADPIGILANTRLARESGSPLPSTWDALWFPSRSKPGAPLRPLAIAGGDSVALTQALVVLTEVLTDRKAALLGVTKLWGNPESGYEPNGKLAADSPFAPALAWLAAARARGDLPAEWTHWTMDDLWMALRDGRCRAAIAPYGAKRRHPVPEAFDLEWMPFPPGKGRTDYSLGAVIVGAELPAGGWNRAGARRAAATFLDPERQAPIARALSFVPLAAELAPFDKETRDARIGLSVAPVFVLPAFPEQLPPGWEALLEAVRAGLEQK